MNYSDKMIKYILKKWYIVLLCAIVGTGALYVEKSKVAPSVAVNGNLLYTRVVKVEPVPYATFGDTAQELNLANLLVSWRGINTLSADFEKNIDIDKLCVGWGNLNLTDRINWVSRHVQFLHVGPGLYELELQLAATDAKDTAYVKENSAKIMDSYVETVNKTAASVVGNSKLQVVDDFKIEDTRQEVTQAGLQKKYLIVGFVLGALAGMAVLALLSLRVKDEA